MSVASPPDPNVRRSVLRAFSLAGAAAVFPAGLAAVAGNRAPEAADLCATPARFDRPLHVPGRDGLFGILRADAAPLRLSAAMHRGDGPTLAFAARSGGRSCVDPTLVAAAGSTLRISLHNALDEPTIAHWHGLQVDTINDGNGEVLAAPGKTFDYAFTVRNRAAMYWYHPHPHGATAGQASRGLFGILMVEDDDEAALRKALALVPGETEIPLVLHDRRSKVPGQYLPTAGDLLHGWYGDEALVNFTPRPYLDVEARRYRFRVLNASNARIYRLGLRNDRGADVPFTLIGTDGGLLDKPQPVREVFLAPSERIDILVDFGGMPIGAFVLLESRAFDPMHLEVVGAATAGAALPDAHGHGAVASDDGSLPTSRSDGGAFALLQFRVRRRGSAAPALPARLSDPPAIPSAAGDPRPLRLGFAKGRWRINDRVYDMGATPIVVARDAIETWLIRNYHSSMPHAMHLHGFPFRVLERETSPEQIAPLAIDERGRLATDLGWKDTVLVWPGESVRVAIDFRHPFAGDQIYLFHCHNLEHEDGGMMLRVKVG
jgi:blue copper oxidase